MDTKNAFAILELNPEASIREAKARYRQKVKQFHPDRFQNDEPLKQEAEIRMKEVNLAFKTVNAVLMARRAHKKAPKKEQKSTDGSGASARPKKRTPGMASQAFQWYKRVFQASPGRPSGSRPHQHFVKSTVRKTRFNTVLSEATSSGAVKKPQIRKGTPQVAGSGKRRHFKPGHYEGYLNLRRRSKSRNRNNGGCSMVRTT